MEIFLDLFANNTPVINSASNIPLSLSSNIILNFKSWKNVLGNSILMLEVVPTGTLPKDISCGNSMDVLKFSVGYASSLNLRMWLFNDCICTSSMCTS